MGQFIKTNGEVQEVTPQNGKHFSLEELQGFVEGYIEIVSIGEKHMVVNEEGKLNGLEINARATFIFSQHYRHRDVIVGNVLLAEPGEII